ncbi:non-ribosomal peptide synthetase [Bacillus cereus]|uniref:non-ribosomal peptide synthetase n=1 Tax=Bacillus cereus TaxID=1396 RepID=UPI0018CE858D|nr:non-ribosomal peptide synthetase [Bacillus cereus]MBG9713648.1 hypothetical protein [Bacillus cereus]
MSTISKSERNQFAVKLPMQIDNIYESIDFQKREIIELKISNDLLRGYLEDDYNNTRIYGLVLSAIGSVLYRYTNETEINFPIVSKDEKKGMKFNFSNESTFKDLEKSVLKSLEDSYSDYSLDNCIIVFSDYKNRDEEIFKHYNGILIQLIKVNCEFILTFEYTVGNVSKEGIKRFGNHIIKMIENFVDNPEKNINLINYLTREEEYKLVVDLNRTKIEYPSTKTIHELFEERVLETPNHIAVKSNEGVLTYNELNLKSNKLANYLIKELCLEVGDYVGVYMNKTNDFVVSILAILKAGGVYVPIDREYPTDRVKHMVSDTRMKVVITDEDLQIESEHSREWSADLSIIHMKSLESLALKCDTKNPKIKITANDLAYVNYTSGSTGKPKGVCIPHKGVVRLVSRNKYIERKDKFILLSSVSFDAATFEIWGSLLNGAELIIPPTFLTLEEIGKILIEEKVSIIWLTAGLFHEIVDENIQILKKIKKLLAGGDVLSISHVKKVINEYPSIRVINGYGPTENTTFTCTYEVEKLYKGQKSIPIGRPIPNTYVLVLDKNKQLVPCGVPGELYASGDGLAKGYLNLPEKNDESFVDVELYNKNLKWYKTGDQVKVLDDGNIEFIGRMDNQVKIRGYRIELEEVRLGISQYKNINNSIVEVCIDKYGDKNLVAYFIANSNINIVELRDFLESKLPSFMIPSKFIQMDSFPLNKNGKIDKAALLNPYELEQYGEIKRDSLKDPITDNVVSIWMDTLGIPNIGNCDNFFKLGGDSLKAIRVISRINKVFHISLSMHEFFKKPTIQAVVNRIKSNKKEEDLIERVENNKLDFPLSPAQEQMFIMDELQSENPAYNIVSAQKINGEINLDLLESSINRVIKRHEILRTYYTVHGDQVVQKISENVQIDVNFTNLEGVIPSKQQEKCDEIIFNESRHKFNLSNPPLIRVNLIRKNLNENILLVVIHHIAFDGWSLDIFFREISNFYKELCYNNQPVDLLPDPIQYKDFSKWQHKQVENIMNQQISYWLEKLRDYPVLELPNDFLRPPTMDYSGSIIQQNVGEKLSEEINSFARKNGSTPYIILMSAFKVLLNSYSQQSDILIGTQVAGRNHHSFEDTIGYFVNNVVIRTNLSDDPTCETLIERVKNTVLEAFENQDLPFSTIVKELSVKRDLSRNPIFQVAFVLQNLDKTKLEISNCDTELLDINNHTAKFDLNLIVEERRENYSVKFEYNTKLFSEDTIKRMLDNYKVVLQELLQDKQRKISELSTISSSEYEKIVGIWNETEVDYGQARTLINMFDSQVTRTPDEVSVQHKNSKITFRELDKKANKLANYLKTLGCISNNVVSIYLDRSIETVVSIIGALKIGAAYLPIDTSYPIERCNYMVENSGSKIIITTSMYKDNFKEFRGTIICVDLDWDIISNGPETLDEAKVSEEDIAYIIYTSGSTGKPKGVKIPHKAIFNHMQWMNNKFPLDVGDVVLQKTPVSFDASVWEFFAPLLSGAKLLLADQGKHIDPEYLVKMIKTENVTVIQTVPTLLEMLLIEPEFKKCRTLKRIFCGGEELTLNLVNLFYKTFDIELINLYGPTEACIDSTYYICSKESYLKNIPIGRPIDNMKIYILDKNLKPTPIGVPGEIYIAGEGLAKGYHNFPSLNDEKFISNHFFRNTKMYKTGDVGKYDINGNIIYISRIDNQVKIRGNRIELGEVKEVITEHSLVKNSVVIPNEEKSNLISFLIVNDDFEILDFKNYLRKKLPEYMVPGHFIYLNSFPTLPNGKIDLKELMKTFKNQEIKKEVNKPRNTFEKKVEKIWADLLCFESVDIYENFFDLGGHSILAFQAVISINEMFGIKISLRDIFEFNTIANLSQRIEELNNTKKVMKDEKISSTQNSEVSNDINLDNLTDKELDLLISQLSE